MTKSRHPSNFSQAGRVLARLCGLLALAAMVFVGTKTSEAKRDPYYVLRGQSLSAFKPRVLIAMDSSGSMTWTVGSYYCSWNKCESNDANTVSGASRISLARKAIYDAISQAQGQADFAFMTFDHLAPPSSAGQVPGKCSDVYSYSGGGGDMGDTRFLWVNNWSSSGTPYINDVYGSNRGTWMLCGTNRPFAYLRYDNAMVGVTLPNNETTPLWNGETVPQGPLAPKITGWSNYYHANNARRKVQFFPRFMGQRIKMNCSDSEISDVASTSYGDYGNGVSNNGAVCGKTFYYWPYVDGFPGYSYYNGYSSRMRINGCRNVCNWLGSCSWECSSSAGSRQLDLGVADREGTNRGTLWAPFYSEAAQNTLTGDNRGPLNRDRANMVALAMTDKMTMGGVDATGGTPLSSMVGNVDNYVVANNGTISGTASNYVNSNAPFRHRDMASYLSFIRRVSPNDLCVPTYAIVISDGEPSSGYGGSTLYSNLQKLRRKLDIKTYSVGFGSGVSFSTINNMACAAAGSSSTSSPCSGTPVKNWDTCRVAGNSSQCGYTASNPQELADALFQIIDGAIETTLPAGPTASANEFISTGAAPGDVDLFQTNITGYTESPDFKGHVARTACDTELPVDPSDPDCADPFDPAYANCTLALPDYCTNAAGQEPPHAGNTTYTDALETEDFALGGSTCSFNRVWDAGECLRTRSWQSRRIYTYDANGNVYRISDDTGTPNGTFVSALMASGAVSTTTEAAAVTRFLLGQNLPDNWKLPGLATSTPVLVRRVPDKDENFRPSVSIRDPHCAGRLVNGIDDVPQSLRDFAEDSQVTTVAGNGLGTHREYQEAVLVGSDFGLLHAFHFDSGNELFALLPPSMYEHIARLTANGTTNFGQLEDLANHDFGVSATINQGYVYDPAGSGKWRHLVTVGMGPGGRDLVALDVAHMGRLGNSGTNVPVEVLWTAETMSGAQGTLLRDTLGETWSRPALTYKVPNDSFINEPEAYLVFASGYDEVDASGQPWRGQALHLVDAITGKTYAESAYFPDPPASQTKEAPTDYAITMDPAIGTHCANRYWGEAEELYIADVAGRFYRWDLGSNAGGNGTSFDHDADSGSSWAGNGNQAIPLFRFGACLGTNEFNCSVSTTVGDHFVYPPAVIATDRIDDPNGTAPSAPVDFNERDQFLIALASGSVDDDKIDGGDSANNFHSSIYLLVDDHYNNPSNAGLNITGTTGSVSAPGASASYMRLPLKDIQRERRWTYADGSAGYELRRFSKKARPSKAPYIRATLPVRVDNTTTPPTYEFDDTLTGVELYEIVYTVYEPGEQSCDPRWKNPATQQWEFDQGSTYEIVFYLSALDGQGFDLINGAGTALGSLFGGSSSPGLTGPRVTQVSEQGFKSSGKNRNIPCDPENQTGAVSNVYSVPVGSGEVDGFTPREASVP